MCPPWITYQVTVNYLQGEYSPFPQSYRDSSRYHTRKLGAVEVGSKFENAQTLTCWNNGQIIPVEPQLLCNPADSIVQALDLLDGSRVVKLNLDSVGLTQDLGTNFLGEFVYGKPFSVLAHGDWFNAMVSNRLLSR
jgi:hypothetical protein